MRYYDRPAESHYCHLFHSAFYIRAHNEIMKARVIITALLTAILTALAPLSSVQALPVYSKYVAMGDSIASGAGLGANLDATCDRSSLAYPSLLANKLGTTVINLACSGAKVDEGIYGFQDRGNAEIKPQLNAAFAGGAPDLITLTIGANDVRWAAYLRDCYIFTCGSALDKARAVIYRADLRFELTKALLLIQQQSGNTPPTVLVNGYYSPFSVASSCSDTNEITKAEKQWIAEQKGFLNDSLRTVVNNFSFATYVPVDFGGHKVCSADPWIQGPNAPAPFHPNVAGQQKLADANFRVLNR